MKHRILTAFIGIAMLTGCPSEKPKGDLPQLHPVKGKVLRNGKPVSGGAVQFNAETSGDSNIVVTGEVSTDGTFELKTLHALSQKMGKGAPTGTYRVTYSTPIGDQASGGSATPKTFDGDKTYTIQDGQNDLTIEVGVKK